MATSRSPTSRRARRVGYQVHEGEPKNSRARVIALDSGTVARLRVHRRDQAAERLAAGPAWVDSGGLVFTGPDGSPIHPQTASWHFERAVGTPACPG